MSDVDLKATKAQFTSANSAARAFHKAETKQTSDVLTTLVGDAITFATALVVVRLALHEQAIKQDVKAKIPTIDSFMATMRGADTTSALEYSKADATFAFAIPTDATTKLPSKAGLVALLATYLNRCARTTNDDGIARNPTMARWDSFKSFVVECHVFANKNSEPKYDAKTGALTTKAETQRDESATTSATKAATIIGADFAKAQLDSNGNDAFKALVALKCDRHDIDAAIAKLAATLSPAQLTEATKQAAAQLKMAVTRDELIANGTVKV